MQFQKLYFLIFIILIIFLFMMNMFGQFQINLPRHFENLIDKLLQDYRFNNSKFGIFLMVFLQVFILIKMFSNLLVLLLEKQFTQNILLLVVVFFYSWVIGMSSPYLLIAE